MAERLERVRSGYLECQRLALKIEEMTALANKVTSVITGMPKGGGATKDAIWAQLIDYKDTLAFKFLAAIEETKALEAELECIRNPSIRTAMMYYYVNGYTIDRIAGQMNYTSRTINRFLEAGRRIYYGYYGRDGRTETG